ncbi:hypothetical protein LEM8419_01700 [Neolewinella maritima]|uniref:Uncharacterized protein n=1 Tax=Neolewinella maritima TaxID=1383882 RepID=A0ABM9B1N6_9BACT|nr:DUF6624 domain-containing protein [Neolewinella maritima]CAH1000566.1 hypothetical protein LEM8419_01700 [Neolewinella maritima]
MQFSDTNTKKGLLKYLYILAVISLGCATDTAYVPHGLTRVSDEELLTRAYHFDYPDGTKFPTLNTLGDTITMDSLRNIQDPTKKYALHYYQDANGVIQEAIIVEITEAELVFQRKLVEAVNTGPELRRLPIDCSDKASILQEVFDRDQAIRGGQPYDKRVDHQNLEVITSFLDHCGMPTLAEVNEVQLAAIWAVLQHSSNRYRKRYLPLLEASARAGDLSWGTIATITDRIALDDGKPQRYGTQVVRDPNTGKWQLYELADPDSVDKLRQAIGLPPLEESLQWWDMD